MNVWRLVDRDHANIAALIREIPLALNGPGVIRSRERLLADLIDALHAHAEAVEAGLLEPLAARGRADDTIADLRREHGDLMRHLDRLSRQHRNGSEGWLNAFEDATYLVDRHLHRHSHEILPLARETLTPDEVQDATRRFARAKMRALRAGPSRGTGPAASGGVFGALAVGLAAAAVGLIAWRSGLLGSGGDRSRTRAAPAPDARRGGEARRHQDRLLDEALEETFPGSDPISPHQITR